MSFSKFATGVAAATLAVSPLAVQAAPVERAAAPVTEESELRGGLLWIVVIIALAIGAILLLDKNDPVSP